MNSSYVIYNQQQKKGLTIDKCLELQQWILDPSSRPYVTAAPPEQKLIIRSAASTAAENMKFTVDKQLALQRMIIG
jgi:hypothetical protein